MFPIFQAHPGAIPFAIAGGSSALLGLVAWRRQSGETAGAFLRLCICQVFWAWGAAVELILDDELAKHLAVFVRFTGVAFTPLALLVFLRPHAEPWIAKRLNDGNLQILTIVPILTLIVLGWNLFGSDNGSGWFWASTGIREIHGFSRFQASYNFWFWIHSAYSYTINGLSVLIVIRSLQRRAQIYRTQSALILFCMICVFLVNLIDILTDWNPFNDYDVTAAVYCLTGLASIPALRRYGLLDIIPASRDRVIQTIRDGIVVLNPDVRLIDINPSACRMIDLDADTAIGQSVDHAFAEWPEVLIWAQDPRPFRFPAQAQGDPDDREYEVLIDALSRREQTIGWVMTLHDLSDRRQAERELRRRYDEQQRRTRIERALQDQQQFLYRLSHELRSPLTPAMAGIARMLEEFGTRSPSRTDLRAIHGQLELAARLVDDLLDLARLESGKLRIDPQPVEVHALIEQALEISRPDLLAAQITTRFQLDAEQTWVHADATRMLQILWNLIKNAARYSYPETTLTIRTTNPPRPNTPGAPEATAERPAIAIAVIDQGIGLTDEQIARIFDPYQQIDKPTEAKAGGVNRGLGLGLTISKSLAEAQDAILEAESPGLGQGATFTVTLPTIAKPDDYADDPDNPSTLRSDTSETREQDAPWPLSILLVDDELEIRTFLGQLLKIDGHQVVEAASQAEALRAVGEHPIDVAISDLNLQDADGRDLLIALGRGSRIQGLLLSGSLRQHESVTIEPGLTLEYVPKPVSLDALRAALRALAGRLDRS